jgi:hypothetical protein
MGCRLIFHGADIVMVKKGLELIRSNVAEHLGLHLRSSAVGEGKSYLER